ncbi:MAG: penicillin-binding protein 2 [Alphaproteobacteria bacterium]|nr:penicillin-binding protein 2 [Alphaproteobacteria bacterium]
MIARFLQRRQRRNPCHPADLQAPPSLVRLDGAAKEVIETGRTRLVTAALLFALCFVVLAARLVDLTFIRNDTEPRVARAATLVAKVDQFPVVDRAAIVDRNGTLLATSLRTASLYADPRKVLNAREAAAKLVRVLPELSQADITERLGSDRSFVWIRRNLTPRQQQQVITLGIPGLYFHGEQRRVYPQGALAVHAVGFTDVDNNGLAGIEAFFNERLRDPARAHEPLSLSLDLSVQHAVRDELLRSVAAHKAIGAAGIVLDARNGEVLAMVSLPDFEPGQVGEASKDQRFNRNTLGVYEMGSTFKTFAAAMALEKGLVNMKGGYDATHPIRIAGFTISDDHPKKRWLSLPEIYMYSSNIAAAKMAVDVGPAGQRAFMQKLGFLGKPAIELPEIGGPLYPRRWNTIETMTIAFGHGISVSPLQLASAVGAMVNGGLLVQPTLIRRDPLAPLPADRVISERTSRQMRQLMRLVVEQGTGKKAEAPGYLVGGKTGTAEKVGAGGYKRKSLLTSFVAAFPMHAPRYVVIAMLDEPKGTKETHGFATAGWTAAPIVGRLVTRIAPILGVPPVHETPEVRSAIAIPGFNAPAEPGRPQPTLQERKLASF